MCLLIEAREHWYCMVLLLDLKNYIHVHVFMRNGVIYSVLLNQCFLRFLGNVAESLLM